MKNKSTVERNKAQIGMLPRILSRCPLVVWHEWVGERPCCGDRLGRAEVVGSRPGAVLLRYR